jgi:hypothetical protein
MHTATQGCDARSLVATAAQGYGCPSLRGQLVEGDGEGIVTGDTVRAHRATK